MFFDTPLARLSRHTAEIYPRGQFKDSSMGDATTPGSSKVRVREITDTDVGGVTDLLARGFPERGRRFWVDVLARLTRHCSPAGLPKFGYLLESDGAPVGTI